MQKPRIHLTDSAYASLRHRDLYAQGQIMQEFWDKLKTASDGAKLDPQAGPKTEIFATPVLGGEYTVVYRLPGDRTNVDVVAVLRHRRDRLSEMAIQKLIESEGSF